MGKQSSKLGSRQRSGKQTAVSEDSDVEARDLNQAQLGLRADAANPSHDLAARLSGGNTSMSPAGISSSREALPRRSSGERLAVA